MRFFLHNSIRSTFFLCGIPGFSLKHGSSLKSFDLLHCLSTVHSLNSSAYECLYKTVDGYSLVTFSTLMSLILRSLTFMGPMSLAIDLML